MREFIWPIRQSLAQGLPPFSRIRRRQFLEECQNLRVQEYGLEEYSPVINAFAAPIPPLDWPFPQIVRFPDGNSYLFNRTTIRKITEAALGWTLTNTNVFNYAIPGQQKSILPGGQWQFAASPHSRTWFATNGQSVIFVAGGLAELGAAVNRIFVQDTVGVQSICYHRGRYIIGGLSNVWGGTMDTIVASWETAEFGGYILSADDMGGRTVMWSSIGGGDFPLWLFHPALAYSVDLGPEEEELLWRTKANLFGSMPTHIGGVIQRIEPLGDQLVVYSEGGIEMLRLETQRLQADMPATYGSRAVYQVPILGRGAVGLGGVSGAEPSEHIFLDKAFDLWHVSVEGIRKIGYGDILNVLEGDDIQISYNALESEYIISDGVESFLLTRRGLSRIKQAVTSAFVVGGVFKGMTGPVTSTEVKVVSNIITFDISGEKEIVAVAVEGDIPDGMEVAIDWRRDTEEDFIRTPFLPLNLQGWTSIKVAGTEFRVALKHPTYVGLAIEGIFVSYQVYGKRYVRGPILDEASARTG